MIKAKEELFKNEVQKTCDKLSITMPKVEFIDGLLPYVSNAMACIDPESRIIYVSRHYLQMMSYEDIRETAIHEITHLFHREHDSSFKRTHIEIMTSTWQPFSTSGLVMIDGNSKPEKKYNFKYSDIKDFLKFYWKVYSRLLSDENPDEITKDAPLGFSDWLKKTYPERRKLKIMIVKIKEQQTPLINCWKCGKEYPENWHRCPNQNCRAFNPNANKYK